MDGKNNGIEGVRAFEILPKHEKASLMFNVRNIDILEKIILNEGV